MKNNNTRRLQQTEEPKHRINYKIRVPEVRLVGDNVEVGVYPTKNALAMADEMNLDLVEINGAQTPPICKIVDYSKFLYEQKKKEKLQKKNSVQVKVKELKFGPNTDDHDFNFKLEHAKKFLEQGHRIKALVQFKGRQIVHKERGEIILLKLLEALAELGKVDQMPKMEGRKMTASMSPKKSKK